jgi:hypothetical protein
MCDAFRIFSMRTGEIVTEFVKIDNSVMMIDLRDRICVFKLKKLGWMDIGWARNTLAW